MSIEIIEATGASVTADELKKENIIELSFTQADGLSDNPTKNTELINRTIDRLSQRGGGTVSISPGLCSVYTICMKSNVNLNLSKGCVLQAAPVGVGNYLEPEVRKYVGLQDHGHTYFRNSLIYAENESNMMICGGGMICGKIIDENGFVQYVLSGADPDEPANRSDKGHRGKWFANKAIAFLNCKNIVLSDFMIDIGGHFAIIATGVDNMLISDLVVDTNRDALDIDCCQNVTVENSSFNSLTDDGIVVKASFGAERILPSSNILIHDCKVSGYDAGSVINGTYSTNKKVADDACGPTGRVKLGTESTSGYDRVTVRRVDFDRSRGFCLEAVDGSPLTNIIFEDCTMKNISSSPMFIRVGDRGRYPLTGRCREDGLGSGDVRVDNKEWVLPDRAEYDTYKPKRYKPSYNRDYRIKVDGKHDFYIVNPKNPIKVNESETDPRRANACGYERLAFAKNIRIKNVSVKDVDPRYPILLAGLVDSPIENVEIINVDVEYRGGITLDDAALQEQIYENVTFSQEGTKPKTQEVPLMVNPFFLKAEGLLPRKSYDEKSGELKYDPYNVPELPDSYPEPSQFGILPAYGLYARHVRNLSLENIRFTTVKKDTRHTICLDDVCEVSVRNVEAPEACDNMPRIAAVRNEYKRHTNMEYYPDEEYFTTGVEALTVSTSDDNKSMLNSLDVGEYVVKAPAPGTPGDSLFKYPTF